MNKDRVRAELKTFIADDAELSERFSGGISLSKILSMEDLEKIAEGKCCKKWIKTPDGEIKCIEWVDCD